MSNFKFSKSSLKNMEGVNHKLKLVAEGALYISLVDFGIPKFGGLRTAEEQYILYMDGKSQLDGTRKKSYHQTGRALDFFAYVDGRASWEPVHLSMVACAFLQVASQFKISLSWGGLWANGDKYYGRDMPHIQLED